MSKKGLSRRQFLGLAASSSAAMLAGCAAPAPVPFKQPAGTTAASARPQNQQALKRVLDQVLNQVKAHFIYDSDDAVYGERDYWNPASEATAWRGDCEDHALLCRKLLRQRGVLNSMLLTCWTEDGQYHAVLYVDGWVLDVRHPRVMSNTELQALGYKWHKVGMEDGRWYYVDQVMANGKI